MIISFLNQKGGVGKSTLARATGIAFVKANWDVHLADMDSTQRTTTFWAQTRKEQGIEPNFSVATYNDSKTALKAKSMADLLIIDGAAYADTHTADVAKASNLIVIPTGVTADDLRASLSLGQELTLKGVSKNSILYVVSRVPENGDKEAMSTKATIREWGFEVTQTWIPYRVSYGKAMDSGFTMSETKYPALNSKADQLIQDIVNKALETESA
jgi:chromosome partitioning protein